MPSNAAFSRATSLLGRHLPRLEFCCPHLGTELVALPLRFPEGPELEVSRGQIQFQKGSFINPLLTEINEPVGFLVLNMQKNIISKYSSSPFITKLPSPAFILTLGVRLSQEAKAAGGGAGKPGTAGQLCPLCCRCSSVPRGKVTPKT